jgi:teichuronic acid biosynthesis glycosyltransferase TuaC
LLQQQGFENINTYILGKGELRSLLENKLIEYGLSERVTLVGQVPNDELITWYNSADLFFLGSNREGWPNVVCEAQACGVPVVATAVHGIPEILDSDDLGIMVDRTPEAFADGIKRALNRSWDRRMIAEKGQKRTWENVALEVRDLFSEVIRNA